MKTFLLLLASVLIFAAVPAYSQTFQWLDDNGTVNFSDNRASIPLQYRKKAVPVGDDDEAPREAPSPPLSRPAASAKKMRTSSLDGPAEEETAARQAASPLDALAADLKKNARSDREKAFAAYDWIVKNIYYDKPELHKRRSRLGTDNQSALAVLESKHAVCAGFANLFTALAVKMGLECVTVTGIAAGARQEGHAWNAVKVDGTWKLVDTVYRHFLTPPEEFIAKHFPFDPQWQLLPKPLTKAEWLKR